MGIILGRKRNAIATADKLRLKRHTLNVAAHHTSLAKKTLLNFM